MEYVTKQEAQNALQSLSNTHLYGRHLVSSLDVVTTLPLHSIRKLSQLTPTIFFQVLERAKEGETLEELRARTAAQYAEEQTGLQNPTKLSKKRKHMAILDEGTMRFEKSAD